VNNSDERNVRLDGQVVPVKDAFRYLGSILQSDGGIEKDINHRIRVGWKKCNRHLAFSVIKRSQIN
jgi:hypothetical protein